MCNIGGVSPESYFKFLQERAIKRREKDEKFKPASEEGYIGLDLHKDPKRPARELRSFATLSYAINAAGERYAGYSGASGGMSRQDETDRSNIFMDTDQSKRRIDRLKGISNNFDPKKPGIPQSTGASRPYCRCAEPAAASIAISHGETIGGLYFAAFTTPEFGEKKADCLFSPCPNCTSFLNRYAAGYFLAKDEHGATVQKAREEDPKFERRPKLLERHNSNIWIINPGRAFQDFLFDIGGRQHALRCFVCAV